MLKLEKVEAAALFGEVALRVHFDGEGPATGSLSPNAAMDLAKQLAKAARAAGWAKPKRGGGDA